MSWAPCVQPTIGVDHLDARHQTPGEGPQGLVQVAGVLGEELIWLLGAHPWSPCC